MDNTNLNNLLHTFFKNSDIEPEVYIRYAGRGKRANKVPRMEKLKDFRNCYVARDREKDWGIPDIHKSKACFIEMELFVFKEEIAEQEVIAVTVK